MQFWAKFGQAIGMANPESAAAIDDITLNKSPKKQSQWRIQDFPDG